MYNAILFLTFASFNLFIRFYFSAIGSYHSFFAYCIKSQSFSSITLLLQVTVKVTLLLSIYLEAVQKRYLILVEIRWRNSRTISLWKVDKSSLLLVLLSSSGRCTVVTLFIVNHCSLKLEVSTRRNLIFAWSLLYTRQNLGIYRMWLRMTHPLLRPNFSM